MQREPGALRYFLEEGNLLYFLKLVVVVVTVVIIIIIVVVVDDEDGTNFDPYRLFLTSFSYILHVYSLLLCHEA